MKPSIIVTIVFLLLVSIAQLSRLILQVHVTANNITIPLWASLIACIFTAVLAVWLWKENKK